MPDLPEQPRTPVRGPGLVPQGNPAPVGGPSESEAGSDTPLQRGNGAQPKERDDKHMDETTARTVAPEDAADDPDRGSPGAVAGNARRDEATEPNGAGAYGVEHAEAEAVSAGDDALAAGEAVNTDEAGTVVTGAEGADRTTSAGATDEVEGDTNGGVATTVAAGTTADGGAGDTGDVDRADDGDGDDEAPAPEARKRRRPLRSAIEWVLVIGGALVVALLIRTFLLQAFWIPTASMEPTLQEGDRVLVNKLSYDLHDVHRGDIIVFERDEEAGDGHPEDDIKDLIKRVIGLPGETIEGRDGVIYVDGERLAEPYLPDGTTTNNLPPTHIPEGHVFVMGDNRGNSSDSRVFGPVDEDQIVGRAFIRIYPLDDIGGL